MKRRILCVDITSERMTTSSPCLFICCPILFVVLCSLILVDFYYKHADRLHLLFVSLRLQPNLSIETFWQELFFADVDNNLCNVN